MTLRAGVDFSRARVPWEATVKSYITVVLLVLVTAFVPTLAIAQNAPATDSRIVSSQESPTRDTTLDENRAGEWGLQPDEWKRYRQLMQGLWASIPPIWTHSQR